MIAPAPMAAETHAFEDLPRRSASAALMPLTEAVALLTAGCRPVPARSVSLAESAGLFAGADIVAGRNSPLRTCALHDGWAVRAEDVFGASPYAPVLLTREPGWVEAGAPMPAGTDAVLPPEALEGRTIVADAPARTGTRAAGEDLTAGTCLVPAGARITPLRRMALRAAGVVTVPVRSPRIGFVVTATPESETLSHLLADLLAADGAVPAEVVHAAGTPEAIAAAIRAARGDATFLIGGTGFGRGDHAAAGLARAGIVHAHGIALKPGETAAFGSADGRPVLLLPGRPDAAIAAYLALGRALVAALSGTVSAATGTAPLLRKVSSTIGLAEIVFARRERDGLLPLGGAGLPLNSLMAADSAIQVAPDSEGHPAGTHVPVLVL